MESYSLMHDGIQKFAKELNGAYVRTLSSSTTLTISLVPWSLTEILRGSLNAEKLVSHLIHLISTISRSRKMPMYLFLIICQTK